MPIFLETHRKILSKIDPAKSSVSDSKEVKNLSLTQVRLIAMYIYYILVTKQQILYQT